MFVCNQNDHDDASCNSILRLAYLLSLFSKLCVIKNKNKTVPKSSLLNFMHLIEDKLTNYNLVNVENDFIHINNIHVTDENKIKQLQETFKECIIIKNNEEYFIENEKWNNKKEKNEDNKDDNDKMDMMKINVFY